MNPSHQFLFSLSQPLNILLEKGIYKGCDVEDYLNIPIINLIIEFDNKIKKRDDVYGKKEK